MHKQRLTLKFHLAIRLGLATAAPVALVGPSVVALLGPIVTGGFLQKGGRWAHTGRANWGTKCDETRLSVEAIYPIELDARPQEGAPTWDEGFGAREGRVSPSISKRPRGLKRNAPLDPEGAKWVGESAAAGSPRSSCVGLRISSCISLRAGGASTTATAAAGRPWHAGWAPCM
jgi:hypothetical protein